MFTMYPHYSKTTISIVGFEDEFNLLKTLSEEIQTGVKESFDGRRLKGINFNWKPASKLPSSDEISGRYSYDFLSDRSYRQFQDNELKFEIPKYTEQDVKSACCLANEKIRNFLIRLSKIGKMIEQDVLDEIQEEGLNKVYSLSLMSKEFLVTCKQDQRTIGVVSKKEDLDENKSIKCSNCGRIFSEENVKEIFTITDTCKNLINNSKWMSVWITDMLIKNGIKQDKIKWRLEANGEELDILITDFNSKVFIELKDRDFGLGDAYPFVTRISRYGGSLGCIITTGKIASDAKKFLNEERQRRPPQMLMEGTHSIEAKVPKMIEIISKLQIRKLVRPLSSMSGTNLIPLINSWMTQKLLYKKPGVTSTNSVKSQVSTELQKLKDTKLGN